VRIDLSGNPGYEAVVNAVAVSAGVVYSGGYVNNGSTNIPCYWKGTIRYELPTVGGNNGNVRGIAVYNGNIYCAGDVINGSTKRPCYWKNGVRFDLPMPSGAALGYAADIEVK